MSSIARLRPLHDRIPGTLLVGTLLLAGIAAIPTGLLGGSSALAMMALGAGVGLAAVLAGSGIARFALRGPDRFGVKLVVGGFIFRVALLGLLLWAIAQIARLPIERFVLWLVFFYFALVMVEAWILARREVEPASAAPKESSSR